MLLNYSNLFRTICDYSNLYRSLFKDMLNDDDDLFSHLKGLMLEQKLSVIINNKNCNNNNYHHHQSPFISKMSAPSMFS